MSDRAWSHKVLLALGLALLGLCALGLGIWIYKERQMALTQTKLTPELAVEALQAAGYSVRNVRTTNDFPGPMAGAEYGLRFTLEVEGKSFSVLTAQYTKVSTAQQSARAVNALDGRMKGGYAYAFSCGLVMVQIFPSDEQVGRELAHALEGSVQ